MSCYSNHDRRVVHRLDGLWGFVFLGNVDFEGVDVSVTKTPARLPVPCAFDALPDYAGQRGVALYRRTMRTEPGLALRLHFEAVSMLCRVYVDGVAVGQNDCGYTPFWCEVPPSDKAEREVCVLVDNRFDFERNPLHEQFFDFYLWGGIIRSVWAHEVRSTFIEAAQVTVLDVDAGKVSVDVRVSGQVPETIQITCDEGEAQSFTYAPGQPIELAIPGARAWSPDSPHLHVLRIEAGEDDFVTRIGLRTITTHKQQILLNGEPLKLLGFNRHESHPQFGPSQPYALMVADLQRLREMGCNFVRGSHYPQDQRFLDLCDELGFLVWEEGLGWGQREKQLTCPKFKAAHERMMRAMVAASFNHPSVIMWGFLNEAGTNEDYCTDIFAETVALLRELDPTRPITYASMFALEDKFYDLVDIISHNLYPGWYGCEDVEKPLELIVPHIRKCLKHIDSAGQADKPYILSEIGVEGLYGWRDALDGFFTEDYQAAYLKIVCEEVMANERITGCALWHFSDARTYAGGRALMRPRAFNNKGVLDEYRRPKKACHTIKETWGKVSP